MVRSCDFGQGCIMKCRTFSSVAIGAIALAAITVSAQKINVEFDRTADFSKYKTFAIRGGQLNSKNPALNSDLIRKQIEQDIARDLAAKGLTQTTRRADLNIRYHLGAARKTQVERYPAGWAGRRTRVVRTAEQEGTLLIDMHDSASQELVWRGIATQEKSNANDLAGKIDDMVRKAIDKYPPKK